MNFEQRASAVQWMKFPGVSPRGLQRETKMYKRGKCILVNLTITPGKKYTQEKVMKCLRCCITRRRENRKTAKPNLRKETNRNDYCIFKTLRVCLTLWNVNQYWGHSAFIYGQKCSYVVWCALCDMFWTHVRGCQSQMSPWIRTNTLTQLSQHEGTSKTIPICKALKNQVLWWGT